MKNEKKIKELLKGSEDCLLVVTKNGAAVVGRGDEILTLLTLLLRNIKECKGCTDELIDEAVKLAKMTKEEIAIELLKKLKETIEKQKGE